ncbi:MAG: ornithine cyclodeaminase family protein [Thermoplasmata archaeon]|nr:ornithine cyclodeaminase family protein [Thermoplasmata archaeon]TFG71043.1 MAG: ornithine cyclodeaminase family protein [Methanomassiliicoccus sp.]
MQTRSDVLVLNKEEIESVITIDDAIDAVEEGFKAFNSGKAVIPFPVALQVPDHSGDIHIKPGYVKGYDTYTVKIASGFYENPKSGLPASHGMLLLFDSRTGYPVCFEVDQCYLTDLRTAAAGAVAARALAKKSVCQVAVIGTGTQARFQIKALSRVREFDELRIWGRNPKRVEEFIADMTDKIDAKIVPASTAEEAVRGSEIVVTATMSSVPIVKASWLSKGVHITAMGSDSPEKQELETAVLGMADKIVVDSLNQCASLGEVHHAIDDGTITGTDVHAELGEVLLGKKSGREREDEVTVCDLTGIAVQDVVTSQIVYERALKKNIGTLIRV